MAEKRQASAGEVRVEIAGFDELRRKLDKIPAEIKRQANKDMLVALTAVEADAKRAASRGKTGNLANTINHRAKNIAGMAVAGEVFTPSKYATIQEMGGTVTPKTAKALTIPFDGVVGRARDFTNTFLTKGGVIMQRLGKDGVRPLFTLKTKVEIPARPFLGPALHKNEKLVTKLLGDAIKRAIQYVAGNK